MSNRTDLFLAGLQERASGPLPDSVTKQATMCVVDYLGCAFLGQSLQAAKTNAYLACMPGDSGNALVIGSGVRAPLHSAALLNAMNAHVAELDDGHRYGMIHVGASVISALLAVAESHQMEGRQFLRGVAMGYEATVRLAASIQPGHKKKGFHASGTCAAIGSALGVAYALGFSGTQLKASLSAAVAAATGLLEMQEDGSTLKPFNVGRAAAVGVDAARIGLAGFEGPSDALGGKRGFLQMAASDVNEDVLRGGLPDGFAVSTVYRKTYAACRHSHAAIEAALVAARANDVAVDDIRSVRVETYDLAVRGHDHKDIAGASSAKMSIPYSVATALVNGDAGYVRFTEECLADRRVRELANRVSVAISSELSALVPDKRAAIAYLSTDEGEYCARVDYPKGEPENPLTVDEINDKFFSLLTAAGQDGEYTSELLRLAWQVGDDLPALLGKLR